MKFSIVMLVSRDDSYFEEAVESVIKQEPDEFRAYTDSVTLKDDTKARQVLKDAGAKIFTQIMDPKLDHHTNIVHNYHRALLEAENKWVIKFDDDDELLGTKRKILLEKYADNDVGIIHGDKKVRFPYGAYAKSFQLKQLLKSLIKPSIQKGSVPENHRDVRFKIYGGTAILNQEAFIEIHPLLAHSSRSSYFYDYETFYWVLRAGWKSVYVPEILFLQKIHAKYTPERKRLWGKWDEIMKEELDSVPDETIEYCRRNKSKNWRFHLNTSGVARAL